MHGKAIFYSQGFALTGDYSIPFQGAPCIILSHGLEGDKNGHKWKLLSERLYNSGFASLRFNYDGCGEDSEKSEGDFADSFLSKRVLDFNAALDYALTLDVDTCRLGAVGSSLGGMVIIASGSTRLKAMVSLATPYSFEKPNGMKAGLNQRASLVALPSGRKIKNAFFEELWKFDMGEALDGLDYPLMVIHGSADQVVPVGDGIKLYKRAKEPKQIRIIEGASHSFDDPVHLTQIVTLACEWLKLHI